MVTIPSSPIQDIPHLSWISKVHYRDHKGQPLDPSFLVCWSGVRLSPLGTSATYQPRMRDDDECGAVGGMRIGRGNRTTRRKPAPVPLCPPQIPHDLTCARTRAAAVGSRRLTAWAMAQPKPLDPKSLEFNPHQHTLFKKHFIKNHFSIYASSVVSLN
jgi:hypothetical protein